MSISLSRGLDLPRLKEKSFPSLPVLLVMDGYLNFQTGKTPDMQALLRMQMRINARLSFRRAAAHSTSLHPCFLPIGPCRHLSEALFPALGSSSPRFIPQNRASDSSTGTLLEVLGRTRGPGLPHAVVPFREPAMCFAGAFRVLGQSRRRDLCFHL
jgi:hypothetical protein